MKQFFRQEILDSVLYHVDHVDGIKLNQNESPWDIPLDLKVRITERLIKANFNRYPVDDLVRLATKIATPLGVTPDQIVISNGSNTIIQALINVIDVRSKILTVDPTFVVYELQAILHGNKIIKVPLSDEFELNTEQMLTAISKEKPGLIFIANPNAPTGSLFDKASLYKIIQMAQCPVVIDEAYYPFTAETVVDWLKDFDNLIVLRTFSKAMALAGVRCGYMIADPEVATQVEKFLMSFRLSVITTTIIEEALDHQDYAQTYIQKIVKERGRLFAEMQKIEPVRVFPSEANFLLFRLENAAEICKKLMTAQVLIRNVGNDGMLKNCLRVSVGTTEENDQFLAALKKVLS